MQQNKQKGAALIVVLSLLSISLMVGLSSMQSSQVDERLAGNYRAASESQMLAEESASYLLAHNVTSASGVGCFDIYESINEHQGIKEDLSDKLGVVSPYASYYYECNHEGQPAFLVEAEVDGAKSYLIFSNGSGSNGSGSNGSGGNNPIKGLIDDVYEDFDSIDLFNYALLVGGALSVNGGATIDGAVRVGGPYSGNKNKDEIGSLVDNDNSNIISEFGYGGLVPGGDLFDAVIDLVGGPAPGDVCSSNASLGVMYCSGNVDLDFDDIKNKSVIVDGSISVKGKSDDGADVFVVSSGSANFSGMGGNTFSGVVWSGGSLVFNGQGGTQYSGSFVSAGSSVYNGGINIKQLSFDEAAPGGQGGQGGQGGMVWDNL
ncbi:pilus assembly PilX family protein [Halomonas sp.]|uniref:pilus assembly PilX family protein n=1 Tax=Halomonas sp. TaxID=1486246 RepID=UPI003D0D7FC3